MQRIERIELVSQRVAVPAHLGRQHRGALLRRERAHPPLMSLRRIVSRAGDEALGSKVEAQVAARHRHAPDHRLDDSMPQHTRCAHVVAGESVRLQGGISREKLITPVAAQRHLHVLSRERREQIRGNDRGVSQRLVEQRGQPRNQAEQHARFERQLVMVGAEVAGDLSRVGRLVE